MDGVSYPVRTVAAGDVIEWKDFVVEGYELSMTTSDGDSCIGGYVVPDRDAHLILTYTAAEEAPKETGCGSVIVGASAALLGLAAVALVWKKREARA